jgi:hypothetical protein
VTLLIADWGYRNTQKEITGRRLIVDFHALARYQKEGRQITNSGFMKRYFCREIVGGPGVIVPSPVI